MYNKEIKQRFLDNYPTNSQLIYERVLSKSEEVEIKYQKDLSGFDIAEIKEVLALLNPQYISTARSNGRILSAYIGWAINQSLRQDDKNPLEEVNNSFFDNFVDKENLQHYFSYNDISNITSFCENAQDAVILQLLFEGVQGKENIEIRNLQYENVDFDAQTLTLTDENETKRTLEVSKDCIKLVDDAWTETTYWKRNGLMEDTPNVRPYTDLVNNNYVVRSSVTKTDSINKPVDKHVIYRRIALISELLSIPNLNAKNIVRSGMIYDGYKYLKEIGSLDKEMYSKIAKKFRINTLPALKEIVSEDNIRKLYDV